MAPLLEAWRVWEVVVASEPAVLVFFLLLAVFALWWPTRHDRV